MRSSRRINDSNIRTRPGNIVKPCITRGCNGARNSGIHGLSRCELPPGNRSRSVNRRPFIAVVMLAVMTSYAELEPTFISLIFLGTCDQIKILLVWKIVGDEYSCREEYHKKQKDKIKNLRANSYEWRPGQGLLGKDIHCSIAFATHPASLAALKNCTRRALSFCYPVCV
ncbi:hypothetical protein V6N13_149299 [Hibiscus sabdariffa]